MGKWLKRISIRAGVIVALLGCAWFGCGIKWGRELDAELADLMAKGVPLTAVENAQKPVPDDQNAAVLYQQVFQVQFARGARQSSLIPGLSQTDWDPLLKVTSEYAYHRSDTASRQVRKVVSRPQVRQTLDVLRRASSRPFCVFPVHWQDGVLVTFPHLHKAREAAWLLGARAALSARDGNAGAACEWSEVALRMAEQIASEPDAVHQHESYRVIATTVRPLQRMGCEQGVPAAAARELEMCLRGMDPGRHFREAMNGYRVAMLEGLEVLDRPGGLETWSQMADVTKDTPIEAAVLTWLYASPLAFPIRKRDRLIGLRLMEELIGASSQPYRVTGPRAEALGSRVQQLINSTLFRGAPEGLSVGGEGETFAGNLMIVRDRTIADIALLRTTLALKEYKRVRGSYPPDLAALQKTLAWALPKDPFSGGDLVYRRQFEGFKLYSLGVNLRDDGGAPERDSAGHLRKNYDIVWQCTK